MNATQITLRVALWRWGRGIARALLLMGAFAGMTLGSVAYAQITFKDKSFAAALAAPAAPTPSLGPGTTNTITFVGEARMPAPPTDNQDAPANNVTITPPGNMAADDFVVIYVAVRDTGTAQTINGVGLGGGNTGGQSWTAPLVTQRQNNVNLRIFHSKFNGTWSGANPSFTWASSLPYQVWMVVFRGVDTTTPIVAVPSPAAFAAATNILIPAGTISTGTVTNAMVVASWHSQDNNTWGSLTAGWSYPVDSGGTVRTQWRNQAGSDSSSSIGFQVQAAAGGNAAVTNIQSGSDAGIRSILALRPALKQLTINKPTVTASGDVLVASIGFRPFCCNTPVGNYTIAPVVDSGTPWTLVRRIDNAPGANILPSHSLAVYSKVAGATEPAAYRWSFSVTGTNNLDDGTPGAISTTFAAAAGGILKFSGVDLSTPLVSVVEENGQCTLAGACTTVTSSHATPSITTTATNTMLVTSYGISNAGPDQWSLGTQADTSVVWTEAIDTGVSPENEAAAMYWGVKPVPGATQSIVATSAQTDIGNAHILALRSTTPGTALTIPIPPNTVAGDVMIASIAVRASSGTACPCPQITIGAAPGWSPVRETPREDFNFVISRQAFYFRVADASDTPSSSYTWTLNAANTGAVGGILSFSGVDTTAPIDNHGGNLSTSPITATGITPNVANTVAVSAHSMTSSVNWTPPADAIAPSADVASRRVVNTTGISLGMYHYAAQTGPPVPTGDKIATPAGDTDTGIAEILALKPAPPPAPAVGGFNAYETSTAAGAITGVIKTKIAGSTVSLDIIALNAAKTAIATTFTGTVRVEVLNASNNTGGFDAGGTCRSTWTVIQTLSDPTFVAGDLGRKTITFTEANSYPDVRLKIYFPVTSPTVIGCSNDNFAIRPNTFASFAVTDTDWQTTGTPGARALNLLTFAATTPLHKAGRPFSVRATARNAAGTPAVTTNYTGAPTATLTACAGAACTAAFGTLTLATTFAAGQLASDVASYDNVGSFRVELVDSSFASVDAGDSSALEREIRSGTIDVGRFVPDHFAVALSMPSFGSASWSCGFTYVGQVFNYTTAPVITLTARNFGGTDTTLYTDNTRWWRITNSSLSGKSYAWAPGGALNTAGAPVTDPVISDAGAGTGTLTFGSGTGFFFTRTPPPSAPFNAEIRLQIIVADLDLVTTPASPVQFGDTTPGNGIAFDNTAKNMRFGRLAVRNANGSQLVPLPVLLETQYWNGTAFVTNDVDNCTTIATNNVAMSNFANNLAACETANTAVSAFIKGRSTLTLAAPGSGNNGSVDLTVNLGASASGNTCTAVGAGPGPLTTTANRPYLQGNWTGGAYDQNPSARATFGVYKGSEEVIFIRENF